MLDKVAALFLCIFIAVDAQFNLGGGGCCSGGCSGGCNQQQQQQPCPLQIPPPPCPPPPPPFVPVTSAPRSLCPPPPLPPPCPACPNQLLPPPLNACNPGGRGCQQSSSCGQQQFRSSFRRLRARMSASLIIDPRCSNTEIKPLIIKNIVADSLQMSKQLIYKAVERQLGISYHVICSDGAFAYLTNTDDYCLANSGDIGCYVFR